MKFGKSIILVLVMTVAFLGANSAMADDLGDPIMRKLGRGVTNVAFGPLEILVQPWDVNRETGALAALTFGVVKGVVYVICREIVGVVEIITFPVPLPGCTMDPLDEGWGYGPIMRPEWVIDVDHNAYGFFFDDTTIVEAK